ncbi:MAG: efflux RND transporter periplasmic adaptor subunit [Acidobacteriota bacterium]
MSEQDRETGKADAKQEGIEKQADPPSDAGSPESSLSVETAPETKDIDEKPKPNGKRRKRIFIIGGVGLFVVALIGLVYWLYARQFESTDDAFIDGDIVQVSPKVSAYVTKIYVKNNQFVHKGDPLVDLDTKDFELKLEQAKAQLENAKSQHGLAQANVALTTKTTGASQTQAKSNVETTKSNVQQTKAAADSKKSSIDQAQAAVRTAQANLAQTKAQVPQVESDVHLAQVEYDRRRVLFDRGDISRQALDQQTNALQTARARLDAAQKQVLGAQSKVDEANSAVGAAEENYRQSLAQVNVTQSQVDESRGRLQDANAAPERIDVSQSQAEAAQSEVGAAQAAVDQAEQELSYAKIVAAEDGYVTRKTIEEGQLVQVGSPMMALSLSDDIWVVANFKETQLEHMRVGQTVDIKVDAFPSQTFKGKIESFQVGTGSRFSVLPSENATGNYVKVVQRVPIKIVFDQKPDGILLAPGMSVEPSVKVR